MGWPTANVAVPEGFPAADGVYAAWVEVAGGASGGIPGGASESASGRRYGAMANLGVKPTFGVGGERVLELHLFDFEGDLYGREVTAKLVERIRPEQKFATPAALQTQIAEDKKSIEKLLCI